MLSKLSKLLKRRDGHSVLSIRHHGHNVFTNTRQEVVRFAEKNPGLTTGVGAIVGTLIAGPAGAQLGAFLGGATGSAVDAEIQNQKTKHDRRDLERKNDEQLQQENNRWNRAEQEAQNQVAIEAAQITAAQYEINVEQKALPAREAVENQRFDSAAGIINNIIDCCAQRNFNHLPKLLNDLREAAGLDVLQRFGLRSLEVCQTPEDALRAAELIAQAQRPNAQPVNIQQQFAPQHSQQNAHPSPSQAAPAQPAPIP